MRIKVTGSITSVLWAIVLVGAACFSISAAYAGTDSAAKNCNTVHMGQPPWLGASVKTSTANWILNELGYKSSIQVVSLPLIFTSLSHNRMDVMFSQWMPSERQVFRKFGINGSIDVIRTNLSGGHYTLGVPQYVYDAGVKSIADLQKYKSEFGGKIYGIGVGSGGNSTIKQMIKDNYDGLGSWKIVPSTTAVMLATVGRHIHQKKWIVFLAWSPHPMNIMYKIGYLSGGTKYWGENKGTIEVNTISRKGYAWSCPNIGQFLDNYVWTAKEQNEAMYKSKVDNMKPLEAGKWLIKKDPKILNRWLYRDGMYKSGPIKTADGKHNALAVITSALDIKDSQ